MLKSKKRFVPGKVRGPVAPVKRTESAVVEITVGPGQAEQIGRALKAVTGTSRFTPDAHATEMKAIAGEILKSNLTARDIQKLRQFGSGRTAPVLYVNGLPQPDVIPLTPYRAFNVDESQVAFADMLLLGAYDVAGIDPVAFTYENLGRLFRNVVPDPDSAGERSSHGSKEPLGWHSDNPCGRFEVEQRMFALADRSPIPRYLGFTPLRNRDAAGRPVPTEVLPVGAALARLDDMAFAALTEHEFQVNPPASNNTAALTEVPLLVRRGGRYLVRFNADEDQVFGLTDKASAALEKFKVALRASADEVLKFDLEPSRLLVFDNYRVLHQRRGFEMGDDWAAARWLRRCYGCMSLTNGVFADRVHQPHQWQ